MDYTIEKLMMIKMFTKVLSYNQENMYYKKYSNQKIKTNRPRNRKQI